MSERWPWQHSEHQLAAFTAAVCIAAAWVGGQFVDAARPGPADPALAVDEVAGGESGPVAVAALAAADPAADADAGPFDVVGMVMTDTASPTGLTIVTSYGSSMPVDLSDVDTYDQGESLEWHVVGTFGGERGDVVVAESARPINPPARVSRDAPAAETFTPPVIDPAIAADSAVPPPPIITMAGTIDDGWAAVGGETTGVVIRTVANEVKELDLSLVRDVFEGTPNRGMVNWIVTGVLEEREYPTRGVVPTIRVTTLRAGGSQ